MQTLNKSTYITSLKKTEIWNSLNKYEQKIVE